MRRMPVKRDTWRTFSAKAEASVGTMVVELKDTAVLNAAGMMSPKPLDRLAIG